MLRAWFVDEVDHRFEGLLLFGVGQRPPGAIDGLARGVERDDAEEILAPAFGRERVAFEVEEDVAGGGLGQELEALVFFEGPKFVERGFEAARFELDPRLVAHFLEAFAGAVLRLEGRWWRSGPGPREWRCRLPPARAFGCGSRSRPGRGDRRLRRLASQPWYQAQTSQWSTGSG